MPYLRRHAIGILGYGECEGQRDRAAHAAPQDHELEARADRSLPQQDTDQRQHAPQAQRPCSERAAEQDAEQKKVAGPRLANGGGHQHRGEHEHQ